MKKHKVFFLGVLVLVLVLTASVLVIHGQLTQNAQGTGAVDVVSDRAKEFITKDSSQGTGLWSEVDLKKDPNSNSVSATTEVTTPCFTVTLPLSMVNQSKEEQGAQCTFRARTLSPPGQLVISSYHSAIPAEDSSLVLRKSHPEEYKELPINVPSFPHSAFFLGSDQATAFAWEGQTMVTVAMSGVAQPTLLTPNLFSELLQTLLLSEATRSATHN